MPIIIKGCKTDKPFEEHEHVLVSMSESVCSSSSVHVWGNCASSTFSQLLHFSTTLRTSADHTSEAGSLFFLILALPA